MLFDVLTFREILERGDIHVPLYAALAKKWKTVPSAADVGKKSRTSSDIEVGAQADTGMPVLTSLA